MDAHALARLPHRPLHPDNPVPTWLWVAPLAVLAVGVAAVAVLLDGVLEHGDLSRYDPTVTSAFIADRSAGLTALARILTFLGSVSALFPLTVVVLAVLLVRHRRGQAVALAGGMTLSVLLTLVLKHLVERDRPGAVTLLGAVDTGFAFPSGHTLNSTVLYGLVAGLLVLSLRSLWARAGIILAWLALALGVGVSRVYLGYHWMTDVLAGWSLGAVVLGAVALTAIVWGRRTTGRGTVTQLSMEASPGVGTPAIPPAGLASGLAISPKWRPRRSPPVG